MASTSSMVMFASASAFDTTGTNDCACAREAISGMTPPYLACSSMDEATTFASSVLPCTTAAAAPSQVDSMPRTIWLLIVFFPGLVGVALLGSALCVQWYGEACGSGIAQGEAHGVGVFVFRLVVAFADSHGFESEVAVQGECRFVVDAHFEQHAFGVEFVGLGDELVDQLGGYALSLAFGADAYGHDLCVISVVPEAGVCVYGSLVVHVHIVAAVWRAAALHL